MTRGTTATFMLSEHCPILIAVGSTHTQTYVPIENQPQITGKEHSLKFGFSSCDFGARLYSPLLCGFDSPDSKASDYLQPHNNHP